MSLTESQRKLLAECEAQRRIVERRVATMNDAEVFIQWKGTDVCLDFHCPCGGEGHVDADFAYRLRCGKCGVVYQMPETFFPIAVADPQDDFVIVDVDMDDSP